jgi:hypothetical protein
MHGRVIDIDRNKSGSRCESLPILIICKRTLTPEPYASASVMAVAFAVPPPWDMAVAMATATALALKLPPAGGSGEDG